MKSQGARNNSIDSFRFIAIACVVVLHTATVIQSESVLGVLLGQFARFAVPYFFIISGFLFYKKVTEPSSKVLSYFFSYGIRILTIYCFWYFVYAIWPLVSPVNWNSIAANGFAPEFQKWWWTFAGAFKSHLLYFVLAGGRGFHLWFLPSLAMAIFLLALSVRINQLKIGFLIAALLFLIALLVAPYKHSMVGLNWGFESRNGPFFSSIFVFIGAMIAKYEFKLTFNQSLLIALIGFFCSLAEVYSLKAVLGDPIYSHNFVFSTLVFATGVALIALSENSIGVKYKLHILGKMALGIYVVHILVMLIFESLGIWPSNNALRVFYCLLASIGVIKVFMLVPFLRRFVT